MPKTSATAFGRGLGLVLGVLLPLQALASTPAAPIAQPVAVSTLQEDPYLLGPGDQLNLRFYDAQELSGPLTVISDGSVSLPLVGNVRVQGLTLSQAERWFTSLFRKQLQNPQLQLLVATPRPPRVALVGEIEFPGVYTLSGSQSGSSSQSSLPALVDGIQAAGGITLNADLRQVMLQRRMPGEPASFKRVSLDLMQLLQEGDQLQNPLLHDGDTIRVPRADQPVAESVEVATANFSPKTIQVYILGEVNGRGSVSVPANTPLIQGIMAAGGPQFGRANKSNVELIRLNRNGTVERRRFRLDLSQGASNAKNPPLRQGDVVIVNRSGIALVSDTITAITQPLTGLVNVWALVQLVQDRR